MADDHAFPPKDRRVQRVATIVTAAFFAFILGFVPMWLTARSRTAERDAAQQSLRAAQIENSLAAAAILARLGEYEAARVSASAFFTSLQAEIERAPSGVAADAREALLGILAQRDGLITLLARGDGAAAERLATLYQAYRRAAGNGARGERSAGVPSLENARVDPRQKFFRNSLRACATSRSQCATAA